ncbi:MAG: phosphotransferase [Ardenticatenaceae bacterium]
MKSEDVLAHLSRRLPDFQAACEPERLTLGEVNFVFRVRGTVESLYPSVIVKHAPPYVATLPDVPLSQERLLFEARALSAFAPQGVLHHLHHLNQTEVRLPHLLDLDEERFVIVMEDLGDAPPLGSWLYHARRSAREARTIGEQIGHFFAQMHLASYQNESLAARFNNQSIHKILVEVYCNNIKELAHKAEIPDADQIGAQAIAFGERLLQPGCCLIMGDLWPRALLMTPDGVRVIDWEMAHFGQPLQDVAHFTAHLWMHVHRAPTPQAGNCARSMLRGFLQSYRNALGKRFKHIFDPAQLYDSNIYFATQIFLHTIGSLQRTYLYDGLPSDEPIVQDAIDIAVLHLRHPTRQSIFSLVD